MSEDEKNLLACYLRNKDDAKYIVDAHIEQGHFGDERLARIFHGIMQYRKKYGGSTEIFLFIYPALKFSHNINSFF